MNALVKEKMVAIIGKYDRLLHMIKRRNLKWYGNISRGDGLSKMIIQGWTRTKLLYTIYDRDGWIQCVAKGGIPLQVFPATFRKYSNFKTIFYQVVMGITMEILVVGYPLNAEIKTNLITFRYSKQGVTLHSCILFPTTHKLFV